MGRIREALTDEERDRAEAVFVEHRRFIENVATRHAVSPDHVPDIVQAVGLSICRRLHTFENRSRLTTWLFRVTVNQARDHYRIESRQARKAEALATHPDRDRICDPDQVVTARERSAALHEAIERMDGVSKCVVRSDLRESVVQRSRGAFRERTRARLRDLLVLDSRMG